MYSTILRDDEACADNKFTSIALTIFLAGAAAEWTPLVLIYPLESPRTSSVGNVFILTKNWNLS
jgi:hypothetical protein